MFVRGTTFILLTLAILFYFSPVLTGVTFCGIIPVLAFGIVYGRKIKQLTKVIQDDKAKMSNVADESFGNIRTVKAFSNEIEETTKFQAHNLDVYKNSCTRAIWYGFFTWFVQVLLYGSMSAIIYIASILYQNGKLEIGTITSFLFYMILLLVNFGIISGVFGNVMQIFGASDKVVMLMNYQPQVNSTGGEKLPETEELKGTIALKDVKFRYPSKKEVQVLKGVTIEVDNKDKRVVALVGTSGCGKSSIISMIERYYDPEEGEVCFNGINIKNLEPRWYHEQISLVQ